MNGNYESSENRRRLHAAVRDAIGQAMNENMKGPYRIWVATTNTNEPVTILDESTLRIVDGEAEYNFTEIDKIKDRDVALFLSSEDNGEEIRIPVTFENDEPVKQPEPEPRGEGIPA